MDPDTARDLLTQERSRVQQDLARSGSAQAEDHDYESQTGDDVDEGQSLNDQAVDDAIATQLQGRLDAIDRALERLEKGTFGVSVRSGKPISDARLEADPAAELTVEEAAADEEDADPRADAWGPSEDID